MFKKRNRIFRQRRAESSEEEDQHKSCCSGEEEKREEGPAGPARQSQLQQGRGISCSSKPDKEHPVPARAGSGDSESEEEDHGAGGGIETVLPDEKRGKRTCLLSFEDDKEGGAQEFKIRKATVNTIVFKSQKKKESKHLFEVKKENLKGCSEETYQEEAKKRDSSDDEAEEENIPIESKDGESSSSSSSSSSSQSSSSETESSGAGDIPDANYIQAARRKRQLERAKGDYIPLDTKRSYVSQDSEHKADSDVDSDNDPDDHERRIELAPKVKALRQRMAEKMGANKSDDDLWSSEDEIEATWEEQQIRKGIKIPQVFDKDSSSKTTSRSFKIKFDSTVSLPVVSLEAVKRRLTSRLKSFQEVHRSHQREHERVLQDIESSRNTVEALEESSSVGHRYKFYKKIKSYVQNLVDCLSEKIVQISALESAMHRLYQQQAVAILKCRQEDVSNESAYLQRLSHVGGLSSNGPMGNEEKRQDLLEACWTRRMRRRQARESSGEDVEHHEGMSSDDEQPPEDITTFQETKDCILRDAEQVFEDVQEEFHSVSSILLKFAQWRLKFFDSYSDAYISLCLPKLLNPLIRLQLIKWNPLGPDCLDLEQMSWFEELKKFSHPPEDMMESCRGDHPENLKTLPSVIEKVVIPKVIDFVELVWDPLSSSQTRRLVQLCRKLQEYSVFKDEPSKVKQALVNSILSRTRKAVDEDVFIPVYPKSIWEDRISPHSKFQDRQFWTAVKLLGNIFQWNGLVPEQPLQEVGLEKLLNRYILITLLNTPPGTDNVEKCRQVIMCFPQSWFKDLKSGATLPQLQNLSQHLMQTAHTLNRNSSEKTSIRKTLAEVALLLENIRALDHAETIIQEYNLQDLKVELEKA